MSFIWTTVYQEIFNKLKKVFITVFCLVLFILGKFVKIKTNILDKGIEVYLL